MSIGEFIAEFLGENIGSSGRAYTYVPVTDKILSDKPALAIAATTSGLLSTWPRWLSQPAPPNGTEDASWGPYDVSSMVANLPYTWVLVGSWPNGLTISQGLASVGGGIISGTPTTTGDHSGLQISAANASGETLNGQNFIITIDIAGVAPAITVQPNPVSVEI